MRRFSVLAPLAFVFLAATFVWASGNIDKHIQDLKSSDPAVRAKAAYDLGCG
jgi:hypothetical protein